MKPKIVVIGGTGLIGSKVVDKLKRLGNDAVAAPPATGVYTMTVEGSEGDPAAPRSWSTWLTRRRSRMMPLGNSSRS